MTELSIDVDSKSIVQNIFCIALASKAGLRKDIDNIFNRDKISHINYYKNSDIYKTVMTIGLNFETGIYTEKMIGILEKSLAEGNMDDVLYLYKKAYRKIYNKTKKLDMIKASDILNAISRGYEGNYEFISTFYIYNVFNKFIFTPNSLEMITNVLTDMYILNKYKTQNFSNTVLKNNIEEINSIKEKLGIKKKLYTMEELIDDIINNDVRTSNKAFYLKTPGLMDDLEAQKKGPVARYIGVFEGILKYLSINSVEFSRIITFNQEEINKMLLNFIYAKLFNNFKDEELPQIIIPLIYLTALNKEYKKLKDTYSTTVNEEYLIEVDNLQKKLNASNIELESLKSSYIDKEKRLAEKENDLIKQIEELKKENNKLKLELSKTEPLKKEITELRNFVFNLDEDIIHTEYEPVNSEKLGNYKIVVIGGNINWVKKLKDLYPNWVFIGEEQKNNDLNFIKNSDCIFINTKMQHSLYFKIRAIADKFNLPIDFLKTNENINITLEQIYNKIKK